MAQKDPSEKFLESFVGSLTGWDDPKARLEHAFAHDEFILYGQPIVPLDPGAWLPPRVEVLVRMQEEERNLTPPGTFIPYLEYYQMMPRLDRWVVEHAIRWWQGKGAGCPALNINLSVETLTEPTFPGLVGQCMGNAGMRGETLCFEVEAVDVATHAQNSRVAAEKLRALGCRVAISGFGRDLVSFEALKTVGAGMVKVDGGLVRELHRDPVAFTRVKSIQGVCGKAGIQTVAEFVEERETQDKLREIGVNYAQGYGIGRPEALK